MDWVRTLRSLDGLTTCEIATPPVPPVLRSYVRSWIGYSEIGPPSTRRELPGPNIVWILEFGPPLRVTESRDATVWSRHTGGFVAGLDDGASLTAHDGRQAGIQLSLTPLGARVLLDLPLSEIARRVISLDDLLPRERSLAERLADAPTWAARFAIVEGVFRRKREAGRTSVIATWATRRIEQASGQIDIASLTAELGYSRKHLASLFHDHVGFPPKLYASLVRFDRLIQELKSTPDRPWADLALAYGYADQAHLVREVKRFAGVRPTTVRELLAGEIPGLVAPSFA